MKSGPRKRAERVYRPTGGHCLGKAEIGVRIPVDPQNERQLQMRWFTSDQHYGHANIIGYCARPFANVHEMNVEMSRRFNELVQPGDEVWHLGDFAMDDKLVGSVLPRLNGIHHLVPGNHDGCHPKHRKHARATRDYLAFGFQSVQERKTLELEGLGPVLMCHMPLRRADPVDEEARGDKYLRFRPEASDIPGPGFLLHGHVHEKWKRRGRMVNVGVDVWDFRPVSEPDLVRYILSDEP